MHAVFMMYGIRQDVELMRNCMSSQFYKMPLVNKDTGEKREIWVQGALRVGAFGIDEYVFPKEYKDLVLTTLQFKPKQNELPYNLGKTRALFLRKLLNCKSIPNFSTDKQLIWYKDNVAIFPIGIREDAELTEDNGENKGFSHEAL
jgi:hypothetical protein